MILLGVECLLFMFDDVVLRFGEIGVFVSGHWLKDDGR